MKKYWQLPEGVDELLPPAANQAEQLRHHLLNLFECWGYKLVSPPLMEFIDSLLVGGSDDLMLSTLKVTDQMSGHTLGIRADISPQVARIDASKLLSTGVQRLCYAGSVLLATPPAIGASRCPSKIGAELYGYQGIEADIEILLLLVESLRMAQVPAFHIELGHVQIFRQLTTSLGLEPEQIMSLFVAVQAKSASELELLLVEYQVDAKIGDLLLMLPTLMGEEGVLTRAKKAFSGGPEGALQAIDQLDKIAQGLIQKSPDLLLFFDLAEVRSYAYHVGAIYTAYVDDLGQPIASGGRYDGLGAAFGRSRPATGFDADLKTLVRLSIENGKPRRQREIAAPWKGDSQIASSKLEAKIAELRKQGDSVILQLPKADSEDLQLKLQWQEGDWQVISNSTLE